MFERTAGIQEHDATNQTPSPKIPYLQTASNGSTAYYNF